MGKRSEMLCEMFSLSRNISNYYFNEIKNEDPHKIFKAGEVPLKVNWSYG